MGKVEHLNFSGRFEDIDELIRLKNELTPEDRIYITLPRRSEQRTYPDLKANALECFLFAIELLRRESSAKPLPQTVVSYE